MSASTVDLPRGPTRANVAVAGVSATVAFIVYVMTLAPGVLWGDSAKLTIYAFEGHPMWDNAVGGHPLHTVMARALASLLDSSEYAWRINLVSALFGAASVGLVAACVAVATNDRFAAAVAAIAFGVSHTHWNYSVIAESYSLVAFFGCGVLLLLIVGHRRQYGRWLYGAAGFVAALSTFANLLLLFALPGYVYLAWRRSSRHAVACAGGFIVGGAVLLAVVASQGALSNYVASGASNVDAYIQPGRFLRELALTPAYVAYNFASVFAVFVALSLVNWRSWSDLDRGLWLSVAGVVVFASSYQHQRHFVFLVMAYMHIAVLGGLAIARLRLGVRMKTALLSATAFLPVACYALAPVMVGDRDLLSARPVPGRDNAYFLSPWKHTRHEPGLWAKQFLEKLAPNGAVFADFTVARVLKYIQEVHRVRPDVTIIETDRWLSPAGFEEYAAALEDRITRGQPTYLAQRFEPYYKVQELASRFVVQPFGVGARLLERRVRESSLR